MYHKIRQEKVEQVIRENQVGFFKTYWCEPDKNIVGSFPEYHVDTVVTVE